MVFTHMTHYAMLGILDEIKDIINFITHRNLLWNLDDGVFKRKV